MTKENKLKVRQFFLDYNDYLLDNSMSICDVVGHPVEESCSTCQGRTICNIKSEGKSWSIDQYINGEFKDEFPEYFL